MIIFVRRSCCFASAPRPLNYSDGEPSSSSDLTKAPLLSLAMGLTTILTTVFVHRNTPKSKILILKENWPSVDGLGHTADVWGARGREFKISPAGPKHSTGHLKLLHHYWARSMRSIVTRKS